MISLENGEGYLFFAKAGLKLTKEYVSGLKLTKEYVSCKSFMFEIFGLLHDFVIL
jgi:hypothetical protein